jgi:hypothetical protein
VWFRECQRLESVGDVGIPVMGDIMWFGACRSLGSVGDVRNLVTGGTIRGITGSIGMVGGRISVGRTAVIVSAIRVRAVDDSQYLH